nr:hypothetical protein CFP56_45970 [Quercus suber]
MGSWRSGLSLCVAIGLGCGSEARLSGGTAFPQRGELWVSRSGCGSNAPLSGGTVFLGEVSSGFLDVVSSFSAWSSGLFFLGWSCFVAVEESELGLLTIFN